jgi:hypothetical protein
MSPLAHYDIFLLILHRDEAMCQRSDLPFDGRDNLCARYEQRGVRVPKSEATHRLRHLRRI